MDFDSKILLEPGFELTAAVLGQMRKETDERYRAVARTLFSRTHSGLIPGCEFCADGGFVGRKYELNGLKCTFLLSGGRLVSIDEDLSLEIPHLTGKEYFLCVGDSSEVHRFEKEGIPYSRPVHILSLKTRESLDEKEEFPLKRFVIDDGSLSVDEDYIVPVLSPATDSRIKDFTDSFTDRLEECCKHANMPKGEGRRSLLHLVFRLKSFDWNRPTSDLLELLHEMVETVDFFITQTMGSTLDAIPSEIGKLKDDPRRQADTVNLAVYLKWVEEFVRAQSGILDLYVPVDNTIDVDELKKQLHDQLHEELFSEFNEKVYGELHDRLSEELSSSLESGIKAFITEELRPELKELIGNELHDVLYSSLYDSLLSALTSLLVKPEEVVEDIFNPII